ncbi:hypothetical protein AB0L00_06850 [Actinoallomurus sp. NPDC052308]|uniref:hypothetical protein n=1 Tax=Actinoallomurus sp. NPDC052308 TaxID=3155530 RepID=UPI0034377CF0
MSLKKHLEDFGDAWRMHSAISGAERQVFADSVAAAPRKAKEKLSSRWGKKPPNSGS